MLGGIPTCIDTTPAVSPLELLVFLVGEGVVPPVPIPVDTEPPELFDITSDPGAFTLDCGPGFFPCPIVESSNE